MDRQPSLPRLAPGAAEQALRAVEELRSRAGAPRVVLRRPEGPLRAWAVVIAVAAAAFLLLLAFLYVVSLMTASRPSL
jgi:hypothetical protein